MTGAKHTIFSNPVGRFFFLIPQYLKLVFYYFQIYSMVIQQFYTLLIAHHSKCTLFLNINLLSF